MGVMPSSEEWVAKFRMAWIGAIKKAQETRQTAVESDEAIEAAKERRMGRMTDLADDIRQAGVNPKPMIPDLQQFADQTKPIKEHLKDLSRRQRSQVSKAIAKGIERELNDEA